MEVGFASHNIKKKKKDLGFLLVCYASDANELNLICRKEIINIKTYHIDKNYVQYKEINKFLYSLAVMSC